MRKRSFVLVKCDVQIAWSSLAAYRYNVGSSSRNPPISSPARTLKTHSPSACPDACPCPCPRCRLDITSQWTSWSWMKYGVSTYDDVNQVYYMTVGINNASGVAIETILGFPLQGGAPIPLPLQPGYDVLSLSWSHSLAAPIILTTDRIMGTLTYLSWNAASSAWIPFFSYADNSVTSNELGQTTITQDGSIIISTLEPASGASGWDFSVSFVSVSSRKEINRILIADGMDLLADLEICNVNV